MGTSESVTCREICLVESDKVRRKPRLLSPIRSFDGAVSVIQAGADEVYCGVEIPGFKKFSLHRGPLCEIPNYDELGRVVKYAHDHGIDVLLTVNRPFMVDVLEKGMRNHISSCLNEGVDALIIGDMGVLSLVKDMDLDVSLYASTYLASMNKEAVDFLRKLGFSRVILERQLTIPEINDIAQHSKVDVEVFIHGSGCSNINVSCYLYHFMYPEMARAILTIDGLALRCGLPFDIYDVDHKNDKLTNTPILDAYRFCSLCQLPSLIQTGVTGFKIVGRCVNEEYQESTTRVYRELIDIIDRGEMKVFQMRLEWLKKNFFPIHQDLPLFNLQELCCDQERCYYSPLFHTPYKIPTSWQTWTKHQFKFIKSVVSKE